MTDKDKPDDDVLNIELEDLDEDAEPPASRGYPATPGGDDDALVIEVEDLDEEPQPAGYPAAAGDYPAVQPGSGYDMYAKAKKNPVAAIFGNLMLQMFIAGLIGGALAGLLNELWYERAEGAIGTYTVVMIFTAVAGGLIGAALGATDGLLTGVYAKMGKEAGLGLLVGAAGGALAGLVAQFAFALIGPDLSQLTLKLILARTIGWALAGMGIGLAQGVRYFNFNRILNGLVGGAVGGFVGGLLFDPITVVTGGGAASRILGLAVIGAVTGAAIGLLEEVRKEAWFTIVEGPLTGKEFILYKQTTSIGSAGYCDIPLLKDPHVAPQHAQIQQSGNAFMLISLAGAEAVLVNGQPTARHSLNSGDLVHIGATAFFYQDRAVEANQYTQ